MLKKINDILAGMPMTLVGGAFLILSFVLPKLGIRLLIDPAWLTVVISGIPLLYLALWRVVYNPGISKISSALLIVIAMFGAIGIGDLFAAGEVVFIMAFGALLEEMTTNRAKKGLKNLISLAPVQGRKLENGKELMIPAEKISRDDILRVLPGETIPVDGIIIEGETSVDQSIMTGESLPVDKGVKDEVFCGTLNRFGAIDIKATNVGQDSSLQKLIRMVQEAENKQAPMQRIADKFASWLVPVALMIAIVTGFATGNIVRAVTVLVVFCPCALVLATPTAIMAAIGQATKHGVIIKSGEALEKMGKVDTITFDKTGTLTYGKLQVSDVISFNDKPDNEYILLMAASAEAKSEHPLGKAIVNDVISKKMNIIPSSAFKMTTGKGIEAVVADKKMLCGNEKFLRENGIEINKSVSDTIAKLHMEGKAAILVAQEGKCIGIIALSDVIRPEAKAVVEKLSKLGTKSVLLTGDNKRTAEYFAAKAGISEVYAELLPDKKVETIQHLQSAAGKVCMIGDGVNDAPALKVAEVGVAMGNMGSDIAVDAADIALMSDDISKVPYLKRLSNATVKTIKLSITMSMLINFVAILLSVTGILNPTTGALVHNAGSCFVVLIAALLYDRKFDD
ncbi:MAG: cation-translocating P-type ATPase [Lachnospiraceae bacterium]|nr:MAG: cation-translocating P-type ATPase [Lachnospiraceae bacterium]